MTAFYSDDTHEYWFHFTLQGRYFAAMDELREPSETAEHHAKYAGRYFRDVGDMGRSMTIDEALAWADKYRGVVSSRPDNAACIALSDEVHRLRERINQLTDAIRRQDTTTGDPDPFDGAP
jgi:hypothetical protein